MATGIDFSGTNTEKIDKLVTAVIELRSTLRLCFYIMGVSFPLLVMLFAFLVTEVYKCSGKVDRLMDQSARVERDISSINERLTKLDKEVSSVSERLGKLERPKSP